MSDDTLSPGEALAVRMFLQVPVLASLRMEDPNKRVEAEFGPTGDPPADAATFEDIEPMAFETDAGEARLRLETKPEGGPAWAVVRMIGARPHAVVDEIVRALHAGTDWLASEDLPGNAGRGPTGGAGEGHRRIKLRFPPDAPGDRFVAIDLLWGFNTEGAPVADLAAWPMYEARDTA